MVLAATTMTSYWQQVQRFDVTTWACNTHTQKGMYVHQLTRVFAFITSRITENSAPTTFTRRTGGKLINNRTDSTSHTCVPHKEITRMLSPVPSFSGLISLMWWLECNSSLVSSWLALFPSFSVSFGEPLHAPQKEFWRHSITVIKAVSDTVVLQDNWRVHQLVHQILSTQLYVE